ncbi:MAG: outer membrane protein transport protein [Pseudomonadales bacterium]|nr:outer membrane protein transport protein [Pseudomonadales bacterium]
MNRLMRSRLCCACLFIALSCPVHFANAQMGQNLLIGNAKAVSLGNAVTADPPGIDSIHFNPAGLARIKGTKMLLKLVVGDADVRGEFYSNDEYEQLLADANLEDPMANSESEIENFAVYLPGMGLTKVPVLAAPLGGASYNPPGSNLTFGTAAYAPLMLGYTRSDDDIGRFYGREMGMARITFLSPTIGWQVSDSLAIGMGIGFSYMGVGLDLDYRAANQLIGALNSATNDICFGDDNGFVWEGVSIDLCGGEVSPFDTLFTLQVELEKTISTTFNLGFLWEPTPWLTLGMVYQSEAKDRLEGDIRVIMDDGIVNLLNAIADSNPLLAAVVEATGATDNGGVIESSGYIDITLPQHLAVGMSLQLLPDLKINVDYKWTETSVWEAFDFRLDESLPVLATIQFIEGVEPDALVIPRGYEDAANFAFGLEYQYSDSLALRMGYEPRNSGIPDDKLDFLIPLGDFDLYGIGFSYRMDRDTIIDVAFAYGKSDQYIPAGSSSNGNSNRLDNFVYNPSAGLDVRSMTEFSILEFSYEAAF